MPNKGQKIGVLLSGGLDSAALVGRYLYRHYEIWPIYVRSGLPWERAELFWVRKFLRTTASPNLHPLGLLRIQLEGAYQNNWSMQGRTPGKRTPDRAVFLPARNLLLVTQALLYLSANNIHQLALGTLKANPFEDGREGYFANLSQLLSLSFGRQVKIHIPFRHLTKSELINRYKRFPLHISFSCLNPQRNNHCGKCNKCAERQKAFGRANVSDPTRYAHARG